MLPDIRGEQIIRKSNNKLSENMNDKIIIRGRSIDLSSIIQIDIDDPDAISGYRDSYRLAKPFPHVVFRNMFSEILLDLIATEFPSQIEKMHDVKSRNESTRRSDLGKSLGVAAQTYINFLHSHRFVKFISEITGIEDLIVDHSLRGAGCHETISGGFFNVHRDFNRHHDNMLANRLVLITYLNRNWRQEFGGALELWDAQARRCEKLIWPEFGTTLLMAHSTLSYHGHPSPLTPPAGMTRKSIAAYFYENDSARYLRPQFRSSFFLKDVKGSAIPKINRLDPIKYTSFYTKTKKIAQLVFPPLLWNYAVKIARKSR